MRALFFSVLGYFLTPAGIVVMALLDASLVFFMPLGIDFVLIIMAARHPELFWLYAVLATIGSVAGAAATFWIGRKVGEHGLGRLVSQGRLERVKRRVSTSAAYSVPALAIIPPPFPFTPFVLTAGALDARPWTFLGSLAGARIARFIVETALAAHYGSGILRWTKTPLFETIVGGFIALAVVGTIGSAVALARGSRRGARSGSEGARPRHRTARARTGPR